MIRKLKPITRRTARAALTSKRFTGLRAARAILAHLVETDHGRPEIFTMAEVNLILEKVTGLAERDVQEWNSMMELYQNIAFTLEEAKVLRLEIIVELLKIALLLQAAAFSNVFSEEQLRALVPTYANTRDAIQAHQQVFREKTKRFLAYQPVLETVSELVGVKLHEGLEQWLEEIKQQAESDQPGTVDDLRPDPAHLQHLKERMSLALGDDSYHLFSEWLTERCPEIVATEEGPDSKQIEVPMVTYRGRGGER